MQRLAFAAALAALSVVPAAVVPANADVVDYAELYGGLTQTPDLHSFAPSDLETDVGYNVGGALGWNIAPDFSAELDLFFTSSDFKGFDESVESFSAIVNVFYYFDTDSQWRPYAGVGLGIVQVQEDDAAISETDSGTAFAYQGMIGVLTKVDTNIDWFVEYRYQGAQDTTLTTGGTTFDQEYASHNLSTGIRINVN